MGTRFTGFFVTNPLILPQNCVALATMNPLATTDHEVATWFHAHLTNTLVSVLRAFTDFGAAESIGVVLFCLVLFFFWKVHLWTGRVTVSPAAIPSERLSFTGNSLCSFSRQ